MSTHNICFHREIRKIIYGYPLLSRAMDDTVAFFHTQHQQILNSLYLFSLTGLTDSEKLMKASREKDKGNEVILYKIIIFI